MRIGLIVLSIGNFGKKGYYNLQEVGLAKALDELCEEVKVYKLVSKNEKYITEKIENTRNVTITYLPSKQIGTNGIPKVHLLDNTLDTIICFSDIQLMVPKVYRWAKENGITLMPYIGVLSSHSTSSVKRILMNWLCQRNIRVYKKCKCLAKTPYIQELLHRKGVKNVYTIPVGLDVQILKNDVNNQEANALRKKWGYEKNDKIILFIGRMTEEKNPLGMIEIFKILIDKNSDYKLIMIGSGELIDIVKKDICDKKLDKYVKVIDKIPNDEIWMLYTIADCFVNLNKQEIFGMAIMEAMYYGCKVVAIEAPGPNYIIENGVSGYLVKDISEIIDIMDRNVLALDKEKVKNRVIQRFTWKVSAETIRNII